jgi:hypothetical protein
LRKQIGKWNAQIGVNHNCTMEWSSPCPLNWVTPMQPHYNERAKQQTQQNGQGSDHSMTLGSGTADSMIQINSCSTDIFI